MNFVYFWAPSYIRMGRHRNSCGKLMFNSYRGHKICSTPKEKAGDDRYRFYLWQIFLSLEKWYQILCCDRTREKASWHSARNAARSTRYRQQQKQWCTLELLWFKIHENQNNYMRDRCLNERRPPGQLYGYIIKSTKHSWENHNNILT